MSDEETPLERIRLHFGVYDENPYFDKSVNTLLNLKLPEAAVREILTGAWSTGYNTGWSDGYDQCSDGA